MKETTHNGLLTRLKERLSLWMLIAFAESFAIILLIILCIGLNKPERIIVTPPNFRSAFWVEGERVDPKYLVDMAKYFAAELLTYSPDNAPGQFENVLTYVDPILSNVLRQTLFNDLEDIRSKARSSVYWIKQVKVEQNTVYVFGTKRDMMSGAVIGDSLKAYKFTFAFKNRLVVTGFEEVKGMMQGGIEEWMRLQENAAITAEAEGKQGVQP